MTTVFGSIRSARRLLKPRNYQDWASVNPFDQLVFVYRAGLIMRDTLLKRLLNIGRTAGIDISFGCRHG